MNTLKPGDTAIIHKGIYRESLVLVKYSRKVKKYAGARGTKDQQLIIRAARNEHVLITGADRTKGWVLDPEQEKQKRKKPIWVKEEWTHRNWKKGNAVLGRADQVFVDGIFCQQVLNKNELKAGSFYLDEENNRLCLWLPVESGSPMEGQDKVPFWDEPVTLYSENPNEHMVEASVRGVGVVIGDYTTLSGIHVRYMANQSQMGLSRGLAKDSLLRTA